MSGIVFGTRNGASKHSEAIVAAVRALHARGLSQREITRRSGVSQRQVGRIVRAEARTGLRQPPRPKRFERVAEILDAWALVNA